MPVYVYVCDACNRKEDIRFGFQEQPMVHCSHCGRIMRRIFTPAPAIFKDGGTGARKSG